jgi:hypothetical protein
MRRQFSALAIVMAFASVGAAQQRPDFSGSWKMDEGRSESPTHEGFVSPVTWTIRQSPQRLIVDITRGSKTMTLTYTLYDKPPAGPTTGGVPSYRGYWDADKLVTETAQNIQGQTVTTKEVRTLQQGGSEMLVERIVQVEHGYTLRGAQNYNTAKDLFTKTAP